MEKKLKGISIGASVLLFALLVFFLILQEQILERI